MKLSRVFTALAIVLVAIAIARSAYLVNSLYDSEVNTIENRLEIPAQSMAHLIAGIDRNANRALRDLQAASSADPGRVGPSLRALMVELTRGRNFAQKIEIYDAKGTAILSTLADPPPPVSVAGYDFFKRQMAAAGDKLIVSSRILDPFDGEPKIVESRAIRDAAGNTRGAIAVYLDVETIQKLFESLPLPPGSALALFNCEGRNLLGTPIETRPGAVDVDYSHRAVFQAFRNAGPQGSFRRFTTMLGQARFVAGVGGPDSDFVVTASWDVATALAHWRSMAVTTIAGTAIAIVIVSALFAYLVFQLRRNEALLSTLSDSEAKFRKLLTALPDAVLLVDQSLTIVFANSAAETLYGYEPGKMNGMAMGKIMPDAIRSEDEEGVRAALNCTDPRTSFRAIERRVRRKDGTELPAEINACPYRAPEGLMLVIAIRDISRRLADHLALERSRENLARAQRVAALGSFERDLATGQVEWSDEFLAIWGIPASAAPPTGESLQQLVHADDVAKFAAARTDGLAGKAAAPLDFRIIRPDGKERVLHSQYDVDFDENGKAVRWFGTVQDITERRAIELELERGRERLARAQRIASIGSFDRDLVTGEIEWSDEFRRIWGIEHAPVPAAAEYLLSLVHLDDRQKFLEGRDLALQRKPVPPLDFQITRPDGEKRILHREYGVVFDDKGRPVRMFGTVQDITERKAIELELRYSRENLARAQSIAGLGSFERDLATGVVTLSDEMYRIHGVERDTPQAELGFLLTLVHVEDRERVEAFRRQAAAGLKPASIDYRIVRPDGVERTLHRTSYQQEEENGQPIRLIGTVQDITERKAIERELQISRENLARAQRVARVGSFERNLVTGSWQWSEELYRLHGLTPDDPRATVEFLRSLVHPDDRERFDEVRQLAAIGITAAPLDFRLIRPDGVERVLHRECEVVCDANGTPLRLIATMQDITEQRIAERRERQLERQLLHSQKLEALGTLAGGIAHDLNNTLVPIMALSRLAARRFEPADPVRADLDTIFEASGRARDLVNRMLAFSRKQDPEKSDTDLAAVLREALKLLRASLPPTIRLETRIGEVPSLPADAAQIHQVITNLVANAAQAIGVEAGTIAVSLETVAGAASLREIRLSVCDTGIGMDEATAHRIFEPFFTTKPVGQGTGLGLSIVHGIVARHDGRIEVSSEPGKGTRFDLYFPLAPAMPLTSSRPAA